MSGVTVVLNQQNTIPGTNPIDNLRKTGVTDSLQEKLFYIQT